MNIVIITFSGIPTTDYCFPLIERLKNKKNIKNVYLLSHSLESKSIFTQFGDSKRVAESLDVINVDLGTYSFLRKVKSVFGTNSREGNKENLKVKIFKRIEKTIIKHFNLTIKSLKIIQPDVVFFDHRRPETIANYKKIFSYLTENNIEVYLTPHAPHYLAEGEHLSTNLNEEMLNKINYLEAFKYSKFGDYINDVYKNILYTSYPGLNSEWLNYVNKYSKYENCLVVMLRPFHASRSKWNLDEKVVLHKDELIEIINCINQLASMNIYKKIIVKPHPKNFKKDLKKDLLPFINHSNIEIYYDSIYNLMSKSNHFLSTYSTTALFSIANSSPTFIVNTKIFSRIFKDWEILKDLYSNFSGFTTSKEIENVVINTKKDKEHLEKYFEKIDYDIF